MTGFGYPEANIGSSSEMSSASSPMPPGYASFNQSINLLMTSAGGILVLVGFVAFGIWLCGKFSDRNGQGDTTSSQAAAVGTIIKPGLSKEAIAKIPVEKIGSSSSDCSCAICLGDFNAEENRGRVLPKCRHSFHVECIDMWLFSHKTCPTCRSDLSSLEHDPGDSVIVVIDSTSSPSSASAAFAAVPVAG